MNSFLTFLTIFKFKFGPLDFTVLVFAISLVILAALKMRPKIKVKFLIVYFAWSFILIIGGLNGDPTSALMSFIRFSLSFWSTFLIAHYFSNKISGYEFINIIAIVLLFHPISLMTELIFPFQREFLSSIIEWEGKENILRVRGFFNSTSSGGNFLGFASIIWAYNFFINGRKWCIVPLLVSLILFPLSALTGLFLTIFGSAIIWFLKDQPLKKKFFVPVITIPSIVIVFLSIFFLVKPNLNQESTSFRALDLIETRVALLLGSEEYSTNQGDPGASFKKLIDSFELPKEDLLFGNGYESKSFMSTTYSDAGIIAKIHQYGFVGIIIIFMLAFLVGSSNQLSFVLICVWVLAFFKNDYLFSRYFFDLIFLISFFNNNWKCYQYKFNYNKP